ncbi:MAG: DUF4012 domain-containing protein [Anaerolineae bacterium]|nr:DUF4012 domain-containing protein [Anaerolineae bacterium]
MTVNTGDVPPTPEISQPTVHKHRKRRHSRSPWRRLRRRISKIKWQVILIAIIFILTVPTVIILGFAADASARVQESLSNMRRVASVLTGRPFSDLTRNDFERIRGSAQELSRSLTSARQQTRPLEVVAKFNADARATFILLDAAEKVALSAQDIIDGLQPVLFFMMDGQQGENSTISSNFGSGERVIELLQLGQSKFLRAKESLTAAKELLNSPDLENVSAQLLLYIEEITQYQAQLQNVAGILVDAPTLMTRAFGVDAPQNYLILSQNNDELRPTGGYISTYGWMTLRRFRITDYGYSPTTTDSPHPPPESMAEDINIPPWWIQFPNPIYTAWDGSWYADYPSTAGMSAWYYDNGDNPFSPIDGVISIDITGFEYILGALGDITIPDYTGIVNASNFRDVVYQIRAEGVDTSEAELLHKKYLVALYNQILSRWQEIDTSNSQAVLNAVLRAVQEKHIMLYFSEPRLNELMDILGWSGKQNPGTGDYLMIADTNMGNKSNHSIVRSVTYDVAIQADRTLKSRTTITYDYPDSLAKTDPAVRPEHYGQQIDYYNLMQVFVPKGSQITETDNLENTPTVTEINNANDFVNLVLVAYDSTERYQYSYTTPPIVEDIGPYQRYRLLIQKQPGTDADKVIVTVTLPSGAQLVNVTPEPANSYSLENQILEFRLDLKADRAIEIVYK